MKIHFLQAGLHTSIQDTGRMGWQDKGIPVGGALDQLSAQKANDLVGNTYNNPVLEITLLGPTIQFSEATQITLTGANLSPRINGKAVENNRTLNLPENAILSFGKPKYGCRCYLAIRGDWHVQKYLDSCSPIPHLAAATPDSIIHKGSFLMMKPLPAIEVRETPNWQQVYFGNDIRLAVMKGPEWDIFSQADLAHFLSTTYTISNEANRMGMRLQPTIQQYQNPIELISSGIVPGTIQIDHAGHPIILLADAQTTGGYPRIANIFSDDLDQLAQLKPRDKIGFVLRK